jgi:Flp pilus assembly protein TadG
MRFWKDEGGQMVPMVAVSLTTLMGFMALAVDVGILFHVRREVQIVADAAATAGAVDFRYNASQASATTAAKAVAAVNGVTDGSHGDVVSVTFPTDTRYGWSVQAVVNVPNPTFFMKLFQINMVTVTASAVAGPGASPGCIWTLGTAGTEVGGSGNLSASGCQIYDDSNDTRAIDAGGSIMAAKVGVTGGSSGSVSPTPITGMTPVSDPLWSLVAPAIPTGVCTSNCNPNNPGSGNMTLSQGTYSSITNFGNGTLTLQPGNYIINGNLANYGNGSLVLGAGNYTIMGGLYNTNAGSVTLGSGLYIVNHLDLTGSGSITGSGVSFYTTGGDTTLTESGSVNLSAPTSGAQNGILIFQAHGDATGATVGGPNMNLQGIVYAPSAALSLKGSGTGTMSADFVVQSLSLSNNTSLQNYATVNNSSPLTTIVMMQ